MFTQDLKGMTSGTPADFDGYFNGSVINVDLTRAAVFQGLIDVSKTPYTAFEKIGGGTLFFQPMRNGIPFQYPPTIANTWGLKLTEGHVSVDQLPFSIETNNGMLVFDGPLPRKAACPHRSRFACLRPAPISWIRTTRTVSAR